MHWRWFIFIYLKNKIILFIFRKKKMPFKGYIYTLTQT